MLAKHEKPHCSFCESTDVSLYSLFGTAQLVRQYYCHTCRSVFEYVRWQEAQDREVKRS